jgi:type VI secretion system protein ImpK
MPDRYQSENLAIVFQEILTAIERLRSNRQVVPDAEAFRAQIREALRSADKEGRQRGYSPEDIRIATFAVVAFLDESILNSRNPAFTDWARKPLQEEIFGHHNAGEVFFQYIERMLAQSDSSALADVLEVYQLCLLLGYGGRYSLTGKAELRAVRDQISEKIRRIRGDSGDLSPSWAPLAGGVVRSQSDPWVKRLTYAAVSCAALLILLFIVYKFVLGSGVSDISAMVGKGAS